MKTKSHKIITVIAILFGVFIIGQFFRPKTNFPATTGEIKVPVKVASVLQRSCFACHSNQDYLSWYDKITPANFLVADHIEKGRAALNFSEWDKLAPPQQKAKLYYALNKILQNEMPLNSYTAIHRNAIVKPEEIVALKEYLLTLNQKVKVNELSEAVINNKVNYDTVKASPNGIEYINDYRNWKAISTTDRFDNGTMRVIFANNIAAGAIKNKQTNPWPDGSIFAKTAWKKKTDTRGNTTTGEFVQVEFMIKDAQKYKATKGWGWARWKGNNLKPYGNDAHFDNECISCHKPVKDNDYVFTAPLNISITMPKNDN